MAEILELPNDEYHRRQEVSASMLKSMAKSWRWFEAEYITRSMPRKETTAMALGTAIHAAVLEPEEFLRNYVVTPPEASDRRTKAHKEWRASIEGDPQILSSGEYDTIRQSWYAVRSHPIVSRLLESTDRRIVDPEQSIIFDDLTGVPCRIRPDLVVPPFIVDIKTTQDAMPGAFAKQAANLHYDLQAAHYTEGMYHVDDSVEWQFLFVAVETSPPFRCRVIDIEENDRMAAVTHRLDLLSEYSLRRQSDDWADEGERNVCTISMPRWHRREAIV